MNNYRDYRNFRKKHVFELETLEDKTYLNQTLKQEKEDLKQDNLDDPT